MRLDAATVRAAARGRWLSAVFPRLAPEMGPALAAGPGRHVGCPVHGGRNGDGFRLYGNAEDTGGAVCNSCGPRHDGFAVLQWLRGWDFPAALTAVADALGLGETGSVVGPPPVSPAPSPLTKPHRAPDRTRTLCRALWREADPVAAFVRAYLAARGGVLPGPLPADLRGHPALTYHLVGGRTLGKYPAMLALLRDGAGRVCGLHRTYLAPDRPAKADLRDPDTGAALPVKKILTIAPSACAGCAVHLDEPAEGVLATCEGIETGVVIQAASGVPTWAAYSAGALGKLELPDTVRRLEMWPDGDPAGTAAARKLAERAEGRGINVRVFRAWKA